MKFAFDIDDTITACPEFFSAVSSSLLAAGHEVILLTDSIEIYRQDIIEYMAELNISYTELVITGNKANYCDSHGIDFAMDDLPQEYYPADKAIYLPLINRIPR